MAYSQDTYLKAQLVLQRRREQATSQQEQRKLQCYVKYPRLEEIQMRLNQIGLQISKSFLQSGDKKAAIDALGEESLRIQEEKAEILKKAGLPRDYLVVQYACNICKDTGIAKDRLCHCHKQVLKDVERERIQQVAPITKCTFASFDLNCYPDEKKSNGISPRQLAESVLNGCLRYGAGFHRQSANLLLIGATGLGKTHLSLAIANSVIDKGYSVIYGSTNAVFSDLEAVRFNRSTGSVAYAEHDLLTCDLLILDDLGAEFITPFSVSCLYYLLNSRILAGLPTIVSTNFNTPDLDKMYDQRITSRLTNEYTVLRLTGEDIRRAKKQ